MALSASPRDNTSATTPSPEPPAHLVAHPVGSAGTDNGILPLSPQHPQAGDTSGHWPYLGLALSVAGELASCGRERGERVVGGRRGSSARGQSEGTPHAGQAGRAPKTAGHRAPWPWALAARTCTRMKGRPHLAPGHTHSGWHQHSTAAGTQNVALGHTQCQGATECASPSAQGEQHEGRPCTNRSHGASHGHQHG